MGIILSAERANPLKRSFRFIPANPRGFIMGMYLLHGKKMNYADFFDYNLPVCAISTSRDSNIFSVNDLAGELLPHQEMMHQTKFSHSRLKTSFPETN